MRFGKIPKCAEIPNSREQITLVLGFCNLITKLLFLHGHERQRDKEKQD